MNCKSLARRAVIATVAGTIGVGVGIAGGADAGTGVLRAAAPTDAPVALDPSPTSSSVPLTVAVTNPTRPRSPTAAPGNARVTLTWLAPSSTGGATINKYAVQRAGHSGGPWRRIAVSTTSRYTATGLTNGERYYFRTRAHNAAGWGPYSTVVTAVPRKVPTAPRSPAATPGNARVKLTWRRPSSTGGAAINRYAVQRTTSSSGTWTRIAYSTTRRYTAKGLTNGTRYYFRVRAHNAAGWGPYSTVVTAVPRTVPSAPLALVATPGNSSVTLSWKPPSNTGGGKIDIYRVQQQGLFGAWNDVASPTGLKYTVGSLTNGTKYSFRIRAHNAAGWGPVSTVVGAGPFTVPGQPDWCAGQQWGGAGSHWMVGKFTPPSSDGGAPVDNYRIDIWGYDNQGIFGPYYHLSEGNILHNDYEYLPYGDYLFSVAAHNAAGLGPACTDIGTLNP